MIDKSDICIPLTFKIAVCLFEPASFCAMQEYSPICSAPTDSILRELPFLPVGNTIIPNSSFAVLLLCNHVIFNGKSPL